MTKSLVGLTLTFIFLTACSHRSIERGGAAVSMNSADIRGDIASVSQKDSNGDAGNFHFVSKYGYAKRSVTIDGKQVVLLNFGDGQKSACSKTDRESGSQHLIQVSVPAPVKVGDIKTDLSSWNRDLSVGGIAFRDLQVTRLTIFSVDENHIEGRVTLTDKSGGSLTGSFNIPICPADILSDFSG